MKNVLKIALCLAAFGVAPLFAQQMYNSCVENEAENCSVTLPSAFNTANSKLPDPFKKIDGTRISTREEWACRRQETLKLAERTVYGTKPPKPATVTGTVSSSNITVNVSEGGRSGNFSVTVQLPTTGTAPYPAVIRYDNSGADATVLRNNGVAVINYTTSTVGGGTRAAKSGVFYTVNNNNKSTGHLAAWAWGVSRIIDVIEQSDGKILKADAIGVTGCSRDGKGAFVAGVLDQRVALTMPMESGTGGMNIMRGAYADRDQNGGTNGAQSPSSAYDEQPWLGDDFNTFRNNVNNLPIDMHQAVALVAPRGFLVLDKTASSSGQWLNIPSSHVAALVGAKVYQALGVGGNLHYINTPTTSHCVWSNNIYDAPLQDFVQKFLHRTKPANGTTPLFTATAAPDTAKWLDWTTPSMSGNLTIGGGCSGTAPSSSSVAASSSSAVTASSSSARSSSSAVVASSSSARSSSSVVASSSSAKSSSSVAEAVSSSSLETQEPSSSSSNDEVSPIVSNSQAIISGSQTAIYYSLQGNRLGSAKPSEPGIYIVKEGLSVKKIVIK